MTHQLLNKYKILLIVYKAINFSLNFNQLSFPVSYIILKQNSYFLLGIKNRAKTIEKTCEILLINIYKKSNQLTQPEQIRSEYIQYLIKRFNEQIEEEKNIEKLYDKIERMQYNLYQKIGTIYSNISPMSLFQCPT